MEEKESSIELKISQIFAEAKKRNPEGYTLPKLEYLASLDTCSTSSSEVLSRSCSPKLHADASPYSPAPYLHFQLSYEDETLSKDEEEKRERTKYINPESGQTFHLLATTVNAPLSLKALN